MKRHWIPLLLVALHPAAALTNVLDAEPLELGAVFAIEALLLGIPVAWTLPDQQNEPPPTEPLVELAIDGFSARWKNHPGLNGEEALVAALLVGFVAAAGAVVWLALTFPYNRGFPQGEVIALLLFSVLFGGVAGLFQTIAAFPSRWVRNMAARRAETEVELQGRELTVGDRSWILRHEDRYWRDDSGVVLQRDPQRLAIRAPKGAARWLVDALDEARPPPDDGTVPEQLQAMRSS